MIVEALFIIVTLLGAYLIALPEISYRRIKKLRKEQRAKEQEARPWAAR